MNQTSTFDTKGKYKVGETYIKLSISFNRENNIKLQQTLNFVVEKELARLREKEKFSFSEDIIYEIEFEKGSTKIRVIFFATLVNGLIFYGSVRQGITQVYNDVKWLSENIIQSARQEDEFIDDNILRTERRTGLTGRIKRNLDRLEYIQNNINDLGNNQVQAEILVIKQDLSNIIQILNQAERETFVNNLPQEIRNHLPEPNDRQVRHLNRLYGLKPEEQ